MKCKQFKNLLFNLDDKTFTIESGSIGTYSYIDIVLCEIVYEKSKYKNKTPLFSKKAREESLGQITWLSNYVFTGLRFVMKNGMVYYVYISDEGSPWKSMKNHEDTAIANEILRFVNKIINKYRNKRTD